MEQIKIGIRIYKMMGSKLVIEKRELKGLGVLNIIINFKIFTDEKFI